jgi:hypothetical protein
MLACCQSPVLSTSFLKEDFGGTHRNRFACMVAKKPLQKAKFLVSKKPLACANSARTTSWMVFYRKILAFAKHTA